ncbi:hypothetical protein EVB91_232 [Rhizobium phage RHph_I1_18]|nr:hypothetical protein EVB91_232 [Rhizobium phage RHph_I1_18]
MLKRVETAQMLINAIERFVPYGQKVSEGECQTCADTRAYSCAFLSLLGTMNLAKMHLQLQKDEESLANNENKS